MARLGVERKFVWPKYSELEREVGGVGRNCVQDPQRQAEDLGRDLIQRVFQKDYSAC